MSQLGYCWANTLKGQYIDGYKHKDIVTYRQNKFLPKLAEIEAETRIWTEGGTEDPNAAITPNDPMANAATTSNIWHKVVWYHDESVFYANNRQEIHWVGENKTPVPQLKGEGASLMVADFVSADYG